MPIRVLVVDDSAFMRRVVGEAIAAQSDMELAGVASNGLNALLKVEQLQPHVVTLDVEMPEMDGLTVLRHLMARYPRPVVMLSSVTHAGAIATIRALSSGAVDFVGKPSGAISLDFHRVRDELLAKIRVAATATIGTIRPVARFATASPARTVADKRWPELNRPAPRGDGESRSTGHGFSKLVVIGTSTGGPRALNSLVAGLPADGRTAYVIVQHMPAGFTRSLAERLDSISPLTIREAVDGEYLTPGTALVAPGDSHLRVTASGTVELDNAAARVHGVRPSVDVALQSAAAYFGGRTVAVILTGMGQDGASGAESVRRAGGLVLAEHESTCVVWGMPRAVVERGAADRVVPLDAMAAAIIDAVATRPLAVR